MLVPGTGNAGAPLASDGCVRARNSERLDEKLTRSQAKPTSRQTEAAVLLGIWLGHETRCGPSRFHRSTSWPRVRAGRQAAWLADRHKVARVRDIPMKYRSCYIRACTPTGLPDFRGTVADINGLDATAFPIRTQLSSPSPEDMGIPFRREGIAHFPPTHNSLCFAVLD